MEVNVPSLVRIKPRAINKLGKYLRTEGFTTAAIFWGEGIDSLFGLQVKVSLDSSGIAAAMQKTVAENDIEKIFDESLELPSGIDVIVAIGGGKVIDYCKYLAFIKKIPFYSVPTIISNDAFASSTASLNSKGKRRSFSARMPYGVIVDTAILMSAPPHFLYSGMGDLFCKITSIYDWKLSYKKQGNYVNDFAASITYNAIDAFYFYTPKSIEDAECVRVIATSLMMTGIAMEIAGSSRPASGSEHLISHAYDRVAEKPSLHGIQVGVASYCCAYLQGRTFDRVNHIIRESGFHDYVTKHPLNKQDFIDAVQLAPSIKENFYTILSERDNIEKLIDFIERDELLGTMLV